MLVRSLTSVGPSNACVVSRMVMLVSELRPNSSVVAEVRPSPNHSERKDGAMPDMIVLHYTGMRDNEAAHQSALHARQRSLRALCGAAGRLYRATGGRGAPRLACRRLVVGRRDRHQFVLDRHRDRQSGARARLSRFSQAPDRGGDRALPQHLHPPPDSRRPGARPFRRRARAQAGSGREVSLEGARRFRDRHVGQACADHPGRPDLRARRDRSRHRGDCSGCSRDTAMASARPAISTARRATPSPHSSAISVRCGSTAWSTCRPRRR